MPGQGKGTQNVIGHRVEQRSDTVQSDALKIILPKTPNFLEDQWSLNLSLGLAVNVREQRSRFPLLPLEEQSPLRA